MLDTFLRHLAMPMSDSVWGVVRALYATVYIAWSMVWLAVVFFYGKTSHVSWVEQGGRYRDAFGDVWNPVLFAYARAVRRVKKVFGGKDDPKLLYEEGIPNRYTIGHYLRFSIFVGAINPVVLGFLLFNVDRSEYLLWMVVMNLAFVLISITSAAGHLFIAYNKKPDTWTNFVIWSTLWMLVSPFGFYFFSWP